MKTVRRAVAAVFVFALVACAQSRIAYGPVDIIDPTTGYYPASRIKTDDDKLLIVTMSGGGKRAAAFAQGMLDALAAIPFGDGTMVDEIDIVSSVSGGSVTAANLVVNGPDSFSTFRERFLYVDHMPRIIREQLLNPPFLWSYLVENNRIESTVRMIEDTVVPRGTTYADIPLSSPYWFANATDLATLQTFAFTQYQFDILCADLNEFPIARAVAASAGFPAAMSSVVLENTAPCPAQKLGPKNKIHPALDYLTAFESRKNFYRGASSYRLERFTAALEHLTVCEAGSECERPEYVHLFDGGITDNLGLSEPLWLITDAKESWNPIIAYNSSGKLKRISMITANAATTADNSISRTPTSPGILKTLSSVVTSGINRRSIGLTSQAGLVNTSIIGNRKEGAPDLKVAASSLAFQRIVDPVCRRRFSKLPTSWGMASNEVSATLALGAAMTFATGPIRKHAGVERRTPEEESWDAAAICLLKKACDCLADAENCTPPEIEFPTCR